MKGMSLREELEKRGLVFPDEEPKAKKHEEICRRLTDLYRRKNRDYGDSFGKSYEKHGMAMPLIRIGDKLSRLENLCKPGVDAEVKDESIIDTMMDLANYSIMTIIELEGVDDLK